MKQSIKSPKTSKSVRFRTEDEMSKAVKSTISNPPNNQNLLSNSRSLDYYSGWQNGKNIFSIDSHFFASVPLIFTTAILGLSITLLCLEETILNLYNSSMEGLVPLAPNFNSSFSFDIKLLQPASESVVYTEDLSPIRLELFDSDRFVLNNFVQETAVVEIFANLITFGANIDQSHDYNGVYLNPTFHIEKKKFSVQRIQNLTLHRGPQVVDVDFWAGSSAELLDCPRLHSCGFHSAVAHVTVLLLPTAEATRFSIPDLAAQDESGRGGCASLSQSLQTFCRDTSFTFLLAKTERVFDGNTIDDSETSGNSNEMSADGVESTRTVTTNEMEASLPPFASGDYLHKNEAVAKRSSERSVTPGAVISQQKGLQILSPLPESVIEADQIQMTLCFPSMWLYVSGRLFKLHLIFDEVVYDVTALLSPLTLERPAEEEQKEILQVISPDRNLTHAGVVDVILGAVRTLKSALMPLRRCYSLDLKGVIVGPHSLQLVAAFLISSVETETGGSGHVAKQEAEILGAEAVRVVRR